MEQLFQKCKKHFSLKTTLLLVDQMLFSLEQLHAKHYIHRDIKPENFMVGLGKKSNTVYMIDFGLSKRFRDPVSGLHIPYKDQKSFTGTARYASISTHLGVEQSRRDDLESLGHIFVYFMKGILPWQNIQAANKKEKYEKITKKKLAVQVNLLCKELPTEFESYLSYCRKMKFNERPDYVYVKRLFKELFVRKSYSYDYIFDWTQPWVSPITVTQISLLHRRRTRKLRPIVSGDKLEVRKTARNTSMRLEVYSKNVDPLKQLRHK